MRLYRSILFIPGNREHMLAKGPSTGADALLLDLEDAVPATAKAEARSMVREYLLRTQGISLMVRINSVSSGLAKADLEAVVVPGLAGIFVPKVMSASEVIAMSTWLDELEGPAGVEPGSVDVVCMLETAGGVRLAYEIATASPRVGSLCYSGAENGDLQTDLGTEWSLEGTEMLYARSKIVLDARAAGIGHPIEGVYADIRNLDGLIADTTLSRRLGYKGRTVIHPSHVEPVNRIYTPAQAEIDYWNGLLVAFETALREGHGTATYDGKMIDAAMAERARRVLALVGELGAAGRA